MITRSTKSPTRRVAAVAVKDSVIIGAPPDLGELTALRSRLAEATDTLRAIRMGEVDSVVISGKKGNQVFTLEGAEHAYRVLIESMNEGALTLTADKTILYANDCFARMAKCPLEQVIGSSFRRFLSMADLTLLRPLLLKEGQAGSKIQVLLKAGDDSQIPVQISIRPLSKNDFNQATIGMVVTDMSETRRAEELLRALTHRVVQVQEVERGRVALELHDNITQLLIAILLRSQTLTDSLSGQNKPVKKEALKLHTLLGEAAEEVERISRNLRPGTLELLGLVATLRATSHEFSERTEVPVHLSCVSLKARMPVETELALYRILQEALKNVGKHAHAKNVTVSLTKKPGMVQLTIKDDGIGFDSDHREIRRNKKGGLGLLGMQERANFVGGSLTVKSLRLQGTEIQVRIPLSTQTRKTKPKQKP